MADEFCRIEFKKKDAKHGDIMKMYDKLAKHFVSVGVHKSEGSKVINKSNGKSFTIIQNACIQEFGNSQVVKKTRRFKSPKTGKWFFIKKGTVLTIPPRIFVRVFSVDNEKKKELTKKFKEYLQTYKFAHPVYDNVGKWAKEVMKQRILSNQIKPDNAIMTIEYKGFNHPLYMNGKLVEAIKSEVH